MKFSEFKMLVRAAAREAKRIAENTEEGCDELDDIISRCNDAIDLMDLEIKQQRDALKGSIKNIERQIKELDDHEMYVSDSGDEDWEI